MSRAISRKTIEDTILSGAREASAAYQRLSGGYWVDFAPESFLQAWLAAAFDKLKLDGAPFRLLLEVSPAMLAKEFGVSIDRRSIKMRPTQRFDLMLLYDNNSPRCPIEIKKAYRADACDNDAQRIREWIKSKSSTVDCGFIVAYTSAKGKNAVKTIKGRFDTMAMKMKAEHYRCIAPNEIDDRGWVWDVACFTIT